MSSTIVARAASARAVLAAAALALCAACAASPAARGAPPVGQDLARDPGELRTGGRPVPMACDDTLEPAASPRADPLRLDFEDVALGCADAALGSWALRVDGSWFHVALKGDPSPSALLLAWGGDRAGMALGFHLPPSEPRPRAMEKVMVDLFGRFGGHDGMLAFGDERYIAFRMMVPSAFETPSDPGSRTSVWQIWQGAPYGPPLRLEIDTEGRAVFLLLNDGTGSHPCASDPSCTDRRPEHGGVIVLHRSAPLDRDVWHDFVVRVIPRHAGSAAPGEIDVWIDRPVSRPPTRSARLALGFDPSGYGSYPDAERRGLRHPNRLLDVSIGIYRTPQHTDQTVFFDRVRVAHTPGDLADSLRITAAGSATLRSGARPSRRASRAHAHASRW